MALKGIDRVKRNYKARVEQISGPVSRAAVHNVLLAGMSSAQVMVPRDTGNLANSAYAPQVTVTNGAVTGHIGYTAEYAAFVHDTSGKLKGLPRTNGNGSYWDPSGEPDFLKKGFEQIKASIPTILKAEYKRD